MQVPDKPQTLSSRSQDELRLVYDLVPVMICVLDAERRVLYANRALYEFVEKAEGTLQGETACGMLGCINALEDPRGCGFGTSCQSCPLRLAMLDTYQTGASHRGIDYRPTVLRQGRRQDMAFLGSTASLSLGGQPVLVLCLVDVTAHKQTKERVRRLAELLDTAPTGTTVHDREGRFLYANDRTFTLHGYTRDEFFQLNLCQVDVPASAEQIAARMAEIEERGWTSFDVEHYRKDGTVVPLRVDAKSARWGDQDVILSVATDVSNLRRIQDALRDREARLRGILEAVRGSVFLLDLEGIILECNETGAERLGASAAELLGKSAYGFLPAELAEARRRKLQGVAETGQPAQFEDQRDGVWFENSVYPVFDRHGAVTQLAIFARDVTLRKRAEESLRQSEAHYRVLAETMLQGVVHQDRDGTIVAMNPAAERILGKGPSEFLGSSSVREEPYTIRPDGSPFPGIEHPSMVALQTGQAVKGVVMGIFNPRIQAYRWISVDAVPLFRPEDPTPFQVYTVFEDITDRRRAEQESRDLQRRLQETQRLESLVVLAGGIAHDFNNILAAIGGFAELVQMSLPPASPVQGDLEMIKQSVERATELTRQMLAYSGKGKFIAQEVNLSRLVANCESLLASCVSKKAAVTYDLAPDLPPIQADPSQMRQLLMNLVINASEALGEATGQIHIATRPVQASAEELARWELGADLPAGLYVCLEVADTGCGMDAATLAKIFDPFFSTKFTGRGLGAPAVHGIARGHRGAIRIASQSGQGTTFEVLLPACSPPVIARTNHSLNHAWQGSGTVLVADDEELVRNLVRRMLERVGSSVVTAGDGAEAMRLFRQHQPEIQLVLLDLTTPRMNGEETLRELRRLSPSVPVIVSSGFSGENAAERFAGLGLAGFVGKPYQHGELIAAVKKALENG